MQYVMLLALLAMLGEVVDSSLGMMYGTLLSPLLIGMGYDARLVVPSILVSQGIGGIVGAVRHHRLGNVNFIGWTRDTKIVFAIAAPGILTVFLGVLVAVSISKFALNAYIGSLVVIMGFLCVRPYHYAFGWWKMIGVGLLSSFNKALSGGGFGPVTSTGKILGGVDAKISIATTTYAEVPICLLGFGLWLGLGRSIEWMFPLSLSIGAVIGGFIGPRVTRCIAAERLRLLAGSLAIGCGLWVLVRLFV